MKTEKEVNALQNEFKVMDSVIYKGKEYKIHSFGYDAPDMVAIRKYRKDGKLDARDRGFYVNISSLTKPNALHTPGEKYFVVHQDRETLICNGNFNKCFHDYESCKEDGETETFFDWCKNSYEYTTIPTLKAENEKLRNDVKVLREALEDIKKKVLFMERDEDIDDAIQATLLNEMFHTCREALNQTGKQD